MPKIRRQNGFTLIEILVVIGIIAILAAVVIVALNPARQFAQARNSQRRSNVATILDAIGQNIADNKGLFTCSGATTTIPVEPDSAGIISNSTSSVNLRPCLVPIYLAEIPVDPKTGTACADSACADGYDTKYTVLQAATSSASRITVNAPDAELGETISVTR